MKKIRIDNMGNMWSVSANGAENVVRCYRVDRRCTPECAAFRRNEIGSNYTPVVECRGHASTFVIGVIIPGEDSNG